MLQLHLFKGKRQPGEAALTETEFQLQCKVAAVLARWCHPDWRYTHMPMGEKRDVRTARRLKAMGTTRGWADFVFFGPDRQVLWLELKRPGVSTLSEHQERLADHLVGTCGHAFASTNDFKTALDWLRQHRIVRVEVSA